MEKVINLGIPHIGEKILAKIDTDDLIQCLDVSEVWKIFAENVLLKRWSGNIKEACITGKTEIVKILLQQNGSKTELNATDVNGRTVFMLTCIKGHKDVAKLLIDHSVELNTKANNGLTAFDYACRGKKTDVVKLLLDYSAMKQIELNHKENLHGRTAFVSACENGDKDVVKILLDYSGSNHIDFNATDHFERTAFMLACCNGHKDVVNLLLDYSASKNIDLEAKSDNGWTASKWASMSGQKEVFELLTTARQKQLNEG